MSRKIRLGNDIDITWSLLDKDEQPYIVEGRDFAVEIHIGKKRFKISNTEASGNSIHFIYYGKDQKVTGPATLVYIENGGRVDMVTFDTKDVFAMVEHSWLAVDSDEQPETVTLDVVTVLSNLESSIGPRGYSAYEIAVQNGYTGTEEEWIASLKPHITADANGNVYCDGELLTDVIYSVVSAVTVGEQGRQEAETTRQTQETARQTAEGRRATAEDGRASAESGRASAEQSRVAAETTRENRSTSDHQRAENDHSRAEQDHQAVAKAVLFTPQTLTEGEKAQARENIGVEGTGTDTEAVHFTPQTLTAEQKAQARTNIDVPSTSEMTTALAGLNDVKYTPQTLTAEQKAQARTNIDVPSTSEMTTALAGLNDVKYTTQSLTEEQKAQARTNIGAGDAETVQELDEKVNGDSNEWKAMQSVTVRNSYELGGSAKNKIELVARTTYMVAVYQILAGKRYRITAQKPGRHNIYSYTAFFGYATSQSSTGYFTVDSALVNGTAGLLENHIIDNDADRFIFICGDISDNRLKCEEFNAGGTPGLDERVEDLEEGAEKTENKVQAISGNESDQTKYPSTKAVADALATKYEKPQTGIPARDLENGVIPDVSGFYTKPASGIPATDLESGVIPDVSNLTQSLTASAKKIWGGTAAEYALLTPSNDTIYFIKP